MGSAILCKLCGSSHRHKLQDKPKCLLKQYQFWLSLKCEDCSLPRSKHLIAAGILSVATMLAYKFAVAEPRKATYAEFYRNYDVEKEYARMREAGIFTAVRPSDE